MYAIDKYSINKNLKIATYCDLTNKLTTQSIINLCETIYISDAKTHLDFVVDTKLLRNKCNG